MSEGLAAVDRHTPLRTSRSRAEVVAFYRDQCTRWNALLAATPLPARPRGRHPDPLGAEITDLRRPVPHMIE